MSLDVVGVSVEAVLVVGHDDLGTLLPQNRGHALGRLAHGRRPERVGVVVLGPAHHARVAVPESHQSTDTENLRRPCRVRCSRICATSSASWSVLVGLDAARCVAELAVGARDEDRAHALVGQDAKEAAGRTRLVVGVGVHRQER